MVILLKLIYIMHSSNTPLTSADIELRNPSGQLIATQNWTGNLAPFNRTTVTINHPVSVAGVYKAKVVNPNGVSDPRPTGDEEEVNVNFGYSNALLGDTNIYFCKW